MYLGTSGRAERLFTKSPFRSPVWPLMVTTEELGTYQPVDVLSMGDGVLGALVMTW
jgi:hypothetical protein